MRVTDYKEDTVKRKVTKIYNDEDDTTLVVTEYLTHDDIPLDRMLKSDDMDFAPDRAFMKSMAAAITEFQLHGITEN